MYLIEREKIFIKDYSEKLRLKLVSLVSEFQTPKSFNVITGKLSKLIKADIKCLLNDVEQLLTTYCYKKGFLTEKIIVNRQDKNKAIFVAYVIKDSSTGKLADMTALKKVYDYLVSVIPGLYNDNDLPISATFSNYWSEIRILLSSNLEGCLSGVINRFIKDIVAESIYQGSKHKILIEYYDCLLTTELKADVSNKYDVVIKRSSVSGLLVTSQGVLGRIRINHSFKIEIDYTTAIGRMGTLKDTYCDRGYSNCKPVCRPLRSSAVKQLENHFEFNDSISLKDNISSLLNKLAEVDYVSCTYVQGKEVKIKLTLPEMFEEVAPI